MIIEERFIISAPIQQVWDFFLDIPRVSQCVPGVQQVDQVADQTFSGSLGVKVGPIKANFSGQATLLELEPPHRLTARAEGKDKTTASMVSATFTATLAEIDPNQTRVEYEIDVAIRGRLGQFGQGVIRETSRQLTQVFVNCVQEQLAAQADAEQTGGASASNSAGGTGSSASSPASDAQAPASPSLLAIFFKAIVVSFGKWFRTLWPGSNKPID